MKLPFSPPFIDDDVIQEVTDTLRSGWLTTGPKVAQLEQELQNYLGAPRVLCISSWSAGAELMLRWWGLRPGDEVILPAYTYCATALAVMHCGAKPVLVDVNNDLTIDPHEVEKAITSQTKAILPVDLGGFPADYTAVHQLAENARALFQPSTPEQEKLGRILVLADAAHSLGASLDKRKVGTLADVTVFSFHAVKNLTTAEGGAICICLPESFDLNELYAELRIMSLNGQTKDALSKSHTGTWRYDVIHPGIKANLSDVHASIGLAQLRKYGSFLLPRRREIARRYSDFFREKNWALLPPVEDGARLSSCHLYPLRIRNATEEKRDLILEQLAAQGVGANVHYIPLPMLSLFRNMGISISDYPTAYENYAREISLPIYPQLSDEEIDFVCQTLADAVSQVL